MKLYSTKREAAEVELPEAVFRGLPPDNGLYMPTELPKLPDAFFESIEQLSFTEIAFTVCKAMVGEHVPDEELKKMVEEAFDFPVPLEKVEEDIYSLELFHGPTLAFKDFGARFMARLMSFFLKGEERNIHILVATSGDTGSAVAQGFLGVPNITVTILYPKGKVSKIQEQQLTTIGQNVTALEIEGAFDDCQKLVKTAFLDKELNEKLFLTSANSINISRLIPQSLYYYYAYARLKKLGKPLVFCTPSGNFGNLCGGLMAQQMGLPISHFVAATNANDVVPHYLETGAFIPKPSVATISNAMDVGNPSNFPRMIALYASDWSTTKSHVAGVAYTDDQTREAMKEAFEHSGYVACPHSAIGYRGIKSFLKEKGEHAVGIFLATAHPCKFKDVVEEVIPEEVEIPERLQQIIDREKQAMPMGNDYSQLKSFLLEKYT